MHKASSGAICPLYMYVLRLTQLAAPRMSYWPMVADALRKDWLPRLLNASELARANPDDFWFTYNDTVLRW